METMVRESWTDERLDDLNAKVAKGFADSDKRFDKLEDRVEALQKEMNLRFEGFQKSLLQAMVGMFGVMMAGFVGLAGLIIALG